MVRALLLAAVLSCVAAGPAPASDTRLSGREGHPPGRFPLLVHAAPTGQPALDAAVRRAVDDWNAVARQALGREAFAWTARADGAQVVLEVHRAPGARMMGVTHLEVVEGVIAPPVRIVVSTPRPRGETPAETVFYQVVAHELGHALGLEHVGEPGSLMCCIPGSIDFDDPATRAAYVAARRHPDVRSAGAQLARHYARSRAE